MPKVVFRTNVLILMCVGYGTLLLMFLAMAWGDGMTADQAYEVVKSPLMALIGGSLAISKDLISDHHSEPKPSTNDGADSK